MQYPSDAAKATTGGGAPLAAGDPIGDDISTAGQIDVDSSTTGLIDHSGDLDYFRITLEAGQAYQFSMAGTGPDAISDPFLEIRDANGNLLKTDDDGGPGINASLMFIAPSAGDYYVVARGWSSEVGRYTLTASAIETGNSSPTQFPPNGLPMYSWEQAALQITRSGASWNDEALGEPIVVTYAFRSTAPGRMPSDTAGFQRFTEAQIAAAEAALQAWAQVANIQFVRVGTGVSGEAAYSNNAAILFANYSSGEAGASAFAYLPQHGEQAPGNIEGDVWVNISIAENQNPTVGSYGLQTLLHEIGHAIGLSHPSDYNAGAGTTITYEGDAEYFNDSRVFTVMTYFGSPPVGGSLPSFASTPQMHDIAAAQYLYGANTSTRTDDTVYGFNSTADRPEMMLVSALQGAAFSIWDGGGNDTLDLSGYAQDATIDLREEAFSSAGPDSTGSNARFNISIAQGVSIENAVGGSGSDTIIGNALANVLFGNAGDDTLLGGDGDDYLQGGSGFDWMVGAEGDDVFAGGEAGTHVMIGGAGVDVASYADLGVDLWIDLAVGAYSDAGVWDSYVELEGLVGGSGNDTLFGTDGANYLEGNAGADTLIGRLGDDILVGGLGDDWLDGGDGNDELEGGFGINVLLGGAGTDLASYAGAAASIWFDLAAGAYSATGVWDAFLSIEGAVGSAFADTLFGDDAANTLEGGGGDDALIGLSGDDLLFGGDGADWIVGGDGNDRLVGGAGVDVYTGGAGADTFDLGADAGWDVAFDFDPTEDRFSLGGHTWSGFLTIDADGDGAEDDTLLGYIGGNFVALDVSGLTLEEWNELLDAPSGAEAEGMMLADAQPMSPASGDDSWLAPEHSPNASTANDLDALGIEVRRLFADDQAGWGLIG